MYISDYYQKLSFHKEYWTLFYYVQKICTTTGHHCWLPLCCDCEAQIINSSNILQKKCPYQWLPMCASCHWRQQDISCLPNHPKVLKFHFADSEEMVKMFSVPIFSSWGLGGTAIRNLSTNNGDTNVGFSCTLDPPWPTPSSPPSSSSCRPWHYGPAERKRYQEQAAKHQAALAKTSDPASEDINWFSDFINLKAKCNRPSILLYCIVTTNTIFNCNHF